MTNILEVKNLKTYFPIRGGLMRSVVNYVRAVDDVSFNLKENETLGLVGESGCGKSTVGRTILHLIPPTSGEVIFENKNLEDFSAEELRRNRIHMQMIFQNPLASLNPRLTVQDILTGAAVFHKLIDKKDAKDLAGRLMEYVGLNRKQLQRFPHEFSGGQSQRICIARALALNPKLLICDEAVSALDVSVQAQILNLFKDLQLKFNMSYLFISHDMGVIRYISDRVAVMYLGKIVEIATRDEFFNNCKHPYSKALLEAIPAAHPKYKKKHKTIKGDVPSPTKVYTGCSFAERCPLAEEQCKHNVPQLRDTGDNHFVSCHLV